MKVKLLVPRIGPAGSENRGDVINIDAAEGKRMIEALQAIPHVPEVKPETRVKKHVAKGKS